jgi:hypothetical protein
MSAMPTVPPDLLLEARSPRWQERSEAAEALAKFEDVAAADALLVLLHDQADTAPMEAAARALIRRRDAYGASLVCKALATGDDETVHELLCFVAVATAETDYELHALAEAALTSDDNDVRKGAQELLDYFGGAAG